MKSASLFKLYTSTDDFKLVGDMAQKTVLSPDKHTFAQARAEADFDYHGCFNADDDAADLCHYAKAVRLA